MDKIVTKMQMQTILDGRPKGVPMDDVIKAYTSNGYKVEGINYEQPKQTAQPSTNTGSALGTAKDLAVGAAKGFANTAQTVAKPITNVMNQVIPGSATGFSQEELTPTNTAQKIGHGVEQVAEFAAPGTAGLKVAKAPGLLNLAARAGTEALGAGATTLAQTGNVGDAVDAAKVGGAFPIAGKALGVVKNDKVAGKLINSLIKTKQGDLAFGKNPGKTVAELGITGNSLEGLVENIGTKKKEVGEQIGSILKSSTEQGKKVNVSDAFKPLDEAITKAKKAELSNAPLITKLENLKTDLTKGKKLDDLTPNEAFDLKKSVAELTKFTGNPSDDKAANAALMDIYSSIRNKIDSAIGDPNLKVLNDHYGNLLTAEKAGAKRNAALEGQNIVSLGGKTLGTGAGLATLLSGGSATPVILAGLAGIGGEKVLSSPAVKSRLAKWLAGKSAEQKKEIFKSAPYLKGLIITNTVEN